MPKRRIFLRLDKLEFEAHSGFLGREQLKNHLHRFMRQHDGGSVDRRGVEVLGGRKTAARNGLPVDVLQREKDGRKRL